MAALLPVVHSRVDAEAEEAMLALRPKFVAAMRRAVPGLVDAGWCGWTMGPGWTSSGGSRMPWPTPGCRASARRRRPAWPGPGRVCDWSVSGLEPTLRVVRAAVAWLWASLQVGVVQPNRSPEGRGSDLAMMGVQLPVCQLLRPHNCAPIDHITLVLTVGRDLQKRRSAQRFPAVS
jgi:hypothetical protein